MRSEHAWSPGLAQSRDLDTLVSDYIKFHRRDAQRLKEFYRSRPRLEEAIREAAYPRQPSGKRHPHQYRRSSICLEEAYGRLERVDFSWCRDFDELHDAIESTVGDILGLGPLYVYDTAVRIGAHLQLEPKRVFLHCGTREGAKALGLGRGRATLEMDELPAALRRLAPDEVEDILCIYKYRLGRAMQVAGRRDRNPHRSRVDRC